MSSRTNPTTSKPLENCDGFAPLAWHARLAAHYGPSGWWPGESPFEIMVGAVLTQNTAWSNVEKAIANLKNAGVLDPAAMFALEPARLAGLIRPSGYYNVKAKRLRNLLSSVLQQGEGGLQAFLAQDAATLRSRLLTINGIGKETADSICCYAAQKPVFVVDAYTRRILLRHGHIDEKAGYDDMQALFMHRLPRELQLFKDLHAYIVFIGKDFCSARQPKCQACPLGPCLTGEKMGTF